MDAGPGGQAGRPGGAERWAERGDEGEHGLASSDPETGPVQMVARLAPRAVDSHIRKASIGMGRAK